MFFVSSSPERVYFNWPTCVQAEAQGNQMRGPQKSSSKLQVRGRGEWSGSSLRIRRLRKLWSPENEWPEISQWCRMVFSVKAQYKCDRCKRTRWWSRRDQECRSSGLRHEVCSSKCVSVSSVVDAAPFNRRWALLHPHKHQSVYRQINHK